jgi:hypothetical protein
MFQKLEILELLLQFDMLPVKGYSGLYRDENSNAILNCNHNQYQEYLSVKNKKIEEKYELDLLKKEINQLKLNMEKILFTINNKQINNL